IQTAVPNPSSYRIKKYFRTKFFHEIGFINCNNSALQSLAQLHVKTVTFVVFVWCHWHLAG
ncbi:hypothetical protein L9F63_009767, partial [Diploptera punctata]